MNKSEETKEKLIALFNGRSGLAHAVAVTPQHVNNWFNRGFSKQAILAVDNAVRRRGGNITVYDLLQYEPPNSNKGPSLPLKRPA